MDYLYVMFLMGILVSVGMGIIGGGVDRGVDEGGMYRKRQLGGFCRVVE